MPHRRPEALGRFEALSRSALAGLLACAAPCAAQAQSSTIVFDGTTGTQGPVLPSGGIYTIREDDGRTVGRNLFQSFSRFHVAQGDVADFTSTSQIDNLIIRNTGMDNPFQVDGMFRSSIVGADVFVLSPSGIVTGQNASLDVPGSIYFSGASNLRFSDGESDFVLDATSPSEEPLLTSLPPAAFGFDGDSGNVTIARTTGFAVSPGETLSFTGARLTGTQLSGQGIGATSLGGPGNTVLLGAASDGELPLDLADLDPEASGAPSMGTIALSSNFKIDVSSAGTGIQAGRVVIRGSRFALAGATIRSRNESIGNALGGIDIAASTDIQLLNGAGIISESAGGGGGSEIGLSAPTIAIRGASEVVSEASGDSVGGDVFLSGGEIEVAGLDSLIAVTSQASAHSGNLDIAADRISVANDAQLVSNTLASAQRTGGSISLEASELVSITEGGQILGLSSGAARGGDVVIRSTPALEVLGGGRIVSEARDQGAGGGVRITAGQVTVAKDPSDLRQTDISTSVLSSAGEGATGGELLVAADDLTLTGGGQIAVDTSGAAPQGYLELRIADSLSARGRDESLLRRSSGLFSRADAGASPGSPDDRPLLFVQTGDLELRDGAEISASTFGDAHGADVEIHAQRSVLLGRTGEAAPLISSSSIGSEATGSAGQLTIQADQVRLRAGGEIVSDTVNLGDAGGIAITARVIDVAGRDPEGARSRISSESKLVAYEERAGSAGSIALTAADSIRVSDHGQVSVSSAGNGSGGSILLEAGRSVTLARGAEIRASADGVADAGTITIRAGDRFESFDADVITRALVLGGGQIRIEASQLINLVDSSVDARVQAGGGDGGDVFIDPDVVVLNNSVINASAIDGFGGNITIVAGQLLQSQGSKTLVTSLKSLPGVVISTAPASQLPSELASIERPFLDASDLMATPCDLRSERSGSFTVALAGGPLSAPDRLLDASLLRAPGGDGHGACEPAEPPR